MKPSPLRAGDRVAAIAPASPFDPETFEAGCRVLEGFGLEVARTERSFGGHYLAGDDDARAVELLGALADRSVRGVFCARGGYGTMRLLPRLAAGWLADDPRWLVGFSDITALLCAGLLDGVVGVHGPLVTTLADEPPDSREHLRRLLFDGSPRLRLAADGPALVAGRASGRLVAGNLAMLGALMGTRWFPDLRGAVLVIEEVGEAPYRLDRLLTQLRLGGVLDAVAAVGVGRLHNCGADGKPLQAVAERLVDLDVPVLAGLSVGHGGVNVALPVGGHATLDADRGELTLGPAAGAV